MNRYLSMGGAAIVGLMVLGLVAICARHPTPVEPGHAAAQHFHAGQLVVELPYELTHRFEFRNDTDHTLEIIELKTSCGCTGVEAPVKSFAPGQVGWVEATAKIHSPGSFDTRATILWSTGEQTRLTIAAITLVSRLMFLSTGSVDLDPGESRTILLTYIDQDGTPPGPINFQTPPGMEIAVAPWKTIIPADTQTGVAGRFCSSVEVRLNAPIDEIGRVKFALGSFPSLQPAELTVRTAALLDAYAREHRALRPTSGPIAIPHAAEPAAAPSPDVSARP